MAGRGVCLSVAEANGRLQRKGKTSLPVPFEPLRNDKFVLSIFRPHCQTGFTLGRVADM